MEGKHPCALPEGLSAQELLWFHWCRSRERLRALASMAENRLPLNENTEYSPELVRQANARALGFQLLFARMRRIENYLEQGRMKRPLLGTLSALSAAELIRANVQRGDSDEAIALFLENWRKPARKPGRPTGSSDCESIAVLALQLHDSDPRRWTWPKVTDQVLNCKSHAVHDSDSECTAKLRQAVTRLRTFLKELQSD